MWSCLKDNCATVVVVEAEEDNFHPDSSFEGLVCSLGFFCAGDYRGWGIKTVAVGPCL